MRPLLRTTVLLFALALAVATAVLALAGPEWAGPAFAIGALVSLAAVPAAGALLRRLHGARAVDASRAPGLVRVVREVAGLAGVPAPRLWIVDDPAPAAFATGLLPRRAALVLTTGLVGLLCERELRAVIAHELAHIRRHDTGPATLCVAVVGLLPMLVLAVAGLDGLDDEAGDDDSTSAWLAAALAPVVAWLLDRLLRADSEFDADRLAGRWCGDPTALADALARIERAAARLPLRTATRHPQADWLLTVPHRPHLAATAPKTALRIERLLAQARAQRAQV